MNLQAVGFPTLGQYPGPRPRDMPDPLPQRPSFMKQRARTLRREAARLADDSILGDADRAEIQRMYDDAEELDRARTRMLQDVGRAVNHPATHHTREASGAMAHEPTSTFTRAMRRMLVLEMRVSDDFADTLLGSNSRGGRGGKGGKGDGPNSRGGRAPGACKRGGTGDGNGGAGM